MMESRHINRAQLLAAASLLVVAGLDSLPTNVFEIDILYLCSILLVFKESRRTIIGFCCASCLLIFLNTLMESLHVLNLIKLVDRSISILSILTTTYIALHYNTLNNKSKLREKQYSKLFDESPSPMFVYDAATTQFLAVNDAALYQYGYTREEFLSMNARQIRPEADIALFEKTNFDVPEPYVDSGKWRHIRKNGEVFFVHIYAHTTHFASRTARLIFALDIDKRVKAEAALHRKSKEVQHILNSVTDAFFAVDGRWNYTFVNRACEQLFKASKSELIGKNIWEAFPRDEHLKFFPAFENAMRKKESVYFEAYNPILKSWLSIKAYPTHEGLSVYAIDITEQKMTEEKAYNDDQKLLAIINNTKDIIWSVDREFNIISANQSFWERLKLITGKSDQEIRRQSFDPVVFESWQGYFKRAFAGEAYKIVLRDELPAGEIFEEISFNPIYGKNHEVIGVSCFSRDITAQETNLRMIKRQNQQLKEIAWIQSHEVRRPVASILGLTSLFDTEDPEAPDHAELLIRVKEAAADLDQIIRKIAGYANGPKDQD